MTDQTAGDITIDEVRGHIARVMDAVHGPDWVFRAPETLPNLLERWMVGVASGDAGYAADQVAAIERVAADRRDREEGRR